MYVHTYACACKLSLLLCDIELNMVISAKDAIKNFNVKLLQKLPLEDDIFFGMAKEANLFPLGSGDSIAAEPTRAKKVAYFLRHVVEPGAEEYLPKLLTVMKESEKNDVVQLADDIQAKIEPGMYVANNLYTYLSI